MITESRFKEAFDRAVHSFLNEEIERRSLASKISTVKTFDKGSKLIVERSGEEPIELEPKEYVSSAIIRNEYIRLSNFDMIRAFFQTLATKMADQQTGSIIEEMITHAGTKIDARGDILEGLIEAAKKLRENGHGPDLVVIMNPDLQMKLIESMQKNPERAELLRKLLSGEEGHT